MKKMKKIAKKEFFLFTEKTSNIDILNPNDATSIFILNLNTPWLRNIEKVKRSLH